MVVTSPITKDPPPPGRGGGPGMIHVFMAGSWGLCYMPVQDFARLRVSCGQMTKADARPAVAGSAVARYDGGNRKELLMVRLVCLLALGVLVIRASAGAGQDTAARWPAPTLTDDNLQQWSTFIRPAESELA